MLALVALAVAGDFVRRHEVVDEHGNAEEALAETESKWWIKQHCIAANGGECWQSTGLTHGRLSAMCGLSGGNGYEVQEGGCPKEYGCRLGEPTSLARYTVGLGMSFWKKGSPESWKGHFSESVPCNPNEETTATAPETEDEPDDSVEDGNLLETESKWWIKQHCIAANGGECWQSTGLTHGRLSVMCGLSGGNGYEVQEGACPKEYGCRLGEPTSLARYTVGLGMSFWKKGSPENWKGHFSESVPCNPHEKTTATVPETEDEHASQDEPGEGQAKTKDTVPCCPDTMPAEPMLTQCRQC